METDAIRIMILSFRAPCSEAGKYGSTLTFEEWDAAYDQFTALETENRVYKDLLRRVFVAFERNDAFDWGEIEAVLEEK